MCSLQFSYKINNFLLLPAIFSNWLNGARNLPSKRLIDDHVYMSVEETDNGMLAIMLHFSDDHDLQTLKCYVVFSLAHIDPDEQPYLHYIFRIYDMYIIFELNCHGTRQTIIAWYLFC